jgi:hypothetical protein
MIAQSTAIAPLIVGIACLIVILGWAAVVLLGIAFLNRHLRSMADAQGQLPNAPDYALLLYALSLFFWPAAFLLGFIYIREHQTARMGRVCLILGLVVISLVVLLTCAGIFAFALYSPQFFQ